jgi:ABC-type multidrug transport system fused ATPase/permease subunit
MGDSTSLQVGQHVMHDLRTAVFRHLQRLSLAFFTRTRTGEVQSRIASDIGGVENVVTSTATQIVSNVATAIASVVAMFLLDWPSPSARPAAAVRAAHTPRRPCAGP